MRANSRHRSNTVTALALTLTFFGGLAFAFPVSSQVATTTSASCSNFYHHDIAVPSGFGAAFDVFSGQDDVSVNCSGGQATFGTGSSTQYVYKTAYIYQNGSWQPLTLTSPQSLVGDTWFPGSAHASLSLPDSIWQGWSFIAAYTCTWTPTLGGSGQEGQWKCGCSDTSCSTHNWQIQAFKRLFSTTTSTGSDSGSGVSQTNGKITGTVTLGPTAPVCHSGSSCSSGFQATLVLADASSTPIKTFETSTEGAFSLSVAPGTYTIIAPSTGSLYPRFDGTDPSPIVVIAGQTVNVTASFDTGIR